MLAIRSVVVVKVVLWVVAMAGCHARRPVSPPDPADDLPEVERGIGGGLGEWGLKADGGIRILVAPDIGSQQVEIGLRFMAGAADDPAGRDGLAHLVEHLILSVRVGGPSAATLDERLMAIASYHNAATSLDSTHYVARVGVDQAGAAVAIMADLLQHASCKHLAAADLARERAIVERERVLRGLADADPIADAITQIAYPPGHPYRRALGGDPTSLARISMEDVCTFLATNYRPERAFFVITGPVSREDVETWSAPLDPIQAGPPPEARLVGRATPARQTRRVTARLPRDTVLLVWPLPGRHEEAGLPVRANAGRLVGELARRHRAGNLGEVWFTTTGGVRAPLLIVGVELGGDTPAQVRAQVADAVATLAAPPPPGHTDYGVQFGALLGIYRQVEDLTNRTTVFADYVQYDASMGMLSSDLDRLDELRHAALAPLVDVLHPDHAGMIVVHGDRRAEAEPAKLVSPVLADPPRTAAAPAEAEPSAKIPAKLVDRSEAFTLANGLRVVVLPAYYGPLVTLRLVVPGGWVDDGAHPGLADLVAETLEGPSEGPGRYGDAANFIDSAAADLDIGVGAATTTFEVTGLSAFQDYLVWGLARTMTDGHHDPAVIARVTARQRRAQGDRDATVWARARRTRQRIAQAVWGSDHPWTASLGRAIDAADLAALTPADLDAFRAARYRPAGAVLFVSGRLSVSLLRPHLERAFAPWTGDAPAVAPARRPTSDRIAVITAATDLRVEVQLPRAASTVAEQVAAEVAAVLLDQRIAAVRATLGAAYALDAAVIDETTGTIAIRGQVASDRAEAAVAVIGRALADLRAGKATPDELARARVRVARQLDARRSIRTTMVDDAVATLLAGQSIGHLTEAQVVARSLTPVELAPAVMQALTGPEVVVLRGSRAATTAGFVGYGAPAAVVIE